MRFIPAPTGTRLTEPAGEERHGETGAGRGWAAGRQEQGHQRADAFKSEVCSGVTHNSADERRAHCQPLQHRQAGNMPPSAAVTSRRGVMSQPKTSVLPSSAKEATAHTAALKDVTGYAYLTGVRGGEGGGRGRST